MDIVSEQFLEARKEKKEADNIRLEKHRKILLILRNGDGERIIKDAFIRISVWKENKTCSMYYIEEWTKILNNIDLYEDIILNQKNHHLRQNTPFRLKDF